VLGGEVVGEVAQDGADLAGEFDSDGDSFGEAGGVPGRALQQFSGTLLVAKEA
jgi:hypothetical protein